MVEHQKWLHVESGMFRKKLGIPEDKKITKSLLVKIRDTPTGKTIKIGKKKITVDLMMKRRAAMAMNIFYRPKFDYIQFTEEYEM